MKKRKYTEHTYVDRTLAAELLSLSYTSLSEAIVTGKLKPTVTYARVNDKTADLFSIRDLAAYRLRLIEIYELRDTSSSRAKAAALRAHDFVRRPRKARAS